MSSNAGGVLGNRDTGSTYMWAKLKSNKVPKNYSVNGLKPSQFAASNDLYGSFCRVRVTLQSDDKRIQEAIRKGTDWSVAYFAVGDSFTCGSWIPSDALEEIANAVADEATADKAASQSRTRGWLTALGTIGFGVGGGALGDSIQKGNILGGLTGLNSNSKKMTSDQQKAANCANYALLAKLNGDISNRASVYANQAITYATSLGVGKGITDAVTTAKAVLGSDCKGAEAKKVCNDYDAALDNLASACTLKKDDLSKDEGSDKNSWIGGAVGSVVGSVAGGILVNKLVGDIQKSSLDAAQKAAYEEWMNNVGRHINCYVGGDEAGEYGDIITTSIE